MTSQKFESMVGKDIAIVKKALNKEFTNELFGKAYYYTRDFASKDYFGMTYNALTIITDNKQTVQSITIHFQQLVDRDFYDAFVKKFGEPSTIQVIDKRTILNKSKIVDDDFTQHIVKSEFSLREGLFEEQPLFIIWKKEQFQIRILLKHKEKRSELEFSLLTKD